MESRTLNYETTKLPIHLATELKIIEGFLEWSASKLTGKKVDKVILIFRPWSEPTCSY
jgi:hypothetical protein